MGFGFVLAYYDLILDQAANDTVADFVREKIGEQVDDPETREKLMPRGFSFGTKRPSVDSNYYPTFNRDDVTLVDVRSDPIERITPTGIATASGHHDLDVLVFATGFDAMTGCCCGRRSPAGTGGRCVSTGRAGPAPISACSPPGSPTYS